MVNEAIKLGFKGRARTLRFGIGPSRILCAEKGITVSDMQSIDINELVQDMIHASLKFDCLLKGEEVDFNLYEVYQWINDMEQSTFQNIFEIFIKTRTVGQSIYDLYLKNLEKAQGEESKAEKKNKHGTI
jgi:hypothetical protein